MVDVTDVLQATPRQTRCIVTHRGPDADAHVATYLAERFLFADAATRVLFVSRSARGGVLLSADCVVDVGNVYDPARLRFDHKPPAFVDRNQYCATRLVWNHLQTLGLEVAPLAALVSVVHQGDHNPPAPVTPELKASRESGLHAQVAQARRSHPGDDAAQYVMVRVWLDARHSTYGNAAPRLSSPPEIVVPAE